MQPCSLEIENSGNLFSSSRVILAMLAHDGSVLYPFFGYLGNISSGQKSPVNRPWLRLEEPSYELC